MKKKLKEICTIEKGKQIDTKLLDDSNSYRYINGGIKESGFYNDFNTSGEAVLISEGGASCGYVNYVNEKFWCGCHCYRLTDINAYPKFLFYSLKASQNGIMELRTGAAMPNIKKEALKNFEVTIIEDKEEQIKIAAHLDTIQSAVDNKKQQLALLDEVVKSEFVEMFGEGSCKQIPFSEYAEIIDGDRGKNYPKSEDFSDDDYCLFLSAKNVTKNGFLFENNQFISKEKDEILRKGKLNRGDIVITTRGTIGNIAYFDDSIPYENIRINSGMVIIRNKDLEFNQRFFLEAFRNKIDEIIATQVTGAAQPQLPIHIMSKITLPYPDLSLQNKFAAFVEQIDKSKFVVKQQIADLQELLDSKMQEYFGE